MLEVIFLFVSMSNLIIIFMIDICFVLDFFFNKTFFFNFIPQYLIKKKFGFINVFSFLLQGNFDLRTRVKCLESQSKLTWVFLGLFLQLIFFSISSFNIENFFIWLSQSHVLGCMFDGLTKVDSSQLFCLIYVLSLLYYYYYYY